jgi:hypothetical protein
MLCLKDYTPLRAVAMKSSHRPRSTHNLSMEPVGIIQNNSEDVIFNYLGRKYRFQLLQQMLYPEINSWPNVMLVHEECHWNQRRQAIDAI